MIIGIDIDNTITETSKKAKEFLKEFNKNYNDYHDLPENIYNEYMQKYAIKIASLCDLKEGVKEAFNYLNSNNYKIIIITARSNYYSKDNIKATKQYLKNNDLKYNKIIFNAEEKGKVAKENNIAIFIDDKESVLDNINQYHIEPIHIGTEQSKYKSFTNWKDIIEYLKTKEGNNGR